MKITAIEKASGSRYKIFVDGEYWYILDIELILQNGLKEGLVCDEMFLEELRQQAERRKAKERALYLLEYRAHTRKELVDKLKRSVSPEIAEETADRMEELSFLNDEDYAERYAIVLLEQKKLGRKAVVYKMQQKGISRELAEQVIDLLHTDPKEQIRTLIEQKYARYLTDSKGIQKVINALARLGHKYQDIRCVIHEYDSEEDGFDSFFE